MDGIPLWRRFGLPTPIDPNARARGGVSPLSPYLTQQQTQQAPVGPQYPARDWDAVQQQQRAQQTQVRQQTYKDAPWLQQQGGWTPAMMTREAANYIPLSIWEDYSSQLSQYWAAQANPSDPRNAQVIRTFETMVFPQLMGNLMQYDRYDEPLRTQVDMTGTPPGNMQQLGNTAVDIVTGIDNAYDWGRQQAVSWAGNQLAQRANGETGFQGWNPFNYLDEVGLGAMGAMSEAGANPLRFVTDAASPLGRWGNPLQYIPGMSDRDPNFIAWAEQNPELVQAAHQRGGGRGVWETYIDTQGYGSRMGQDVLLDPLTWASLGAGALAKIPALSRVARPLMEIIELPDDILLKTLGIPFRALGQAPDVARAVRYGLESLIPGHTPTYRIGNDARLAGWVEQEIVRPFRRGLGIHENPLDTGVNYRTAAAAAIPGDPIPVVDPASTGRLSPRMEAFGQWIKEVPARQQVDQTTNDVVGVEDRIRQFIANNIVERGKQTFNLGHYDPAYLREESRQRYYDRLKAEVEAEKQQAVDVIRPRLATLRSSRTRPVEPGPVYPTRDLQRYDPRFKPKNADVDDGYRATYFSNLVAEAGRTHRDEVEEVWARAEPYLQSVIERTAIREATPIERAESMMRFEEIVLDALGEENLPPYTIATMAERMAGLVERAVFEPSDEVAGLYLSRVEADFGPQVAAEVEALRQLRHERRLMREVNYRYDQAVSPPPTPGPAGPAPATTPGAPAVADPELPETTAPAAPDVDDAPAGPAPASQGFVPSAFMGGDTPYARAYHAVQEQIRALARKRDQLRAQAHYEYEDAVAISMEQEARSLDQQIPPLQAQLARIVDEYRASISADPVAVVTTTPPPATTPVQVASASRSVALPDSPLPNILDVFSYEAPDGRKMVRLWGSSRNGRFTPDVMVAKRAWVDETRGDFTKGGLYRIDLPLDVARSLPSDGHWFHLDPAFAEAVEAASTEEWLFLAGETMDKVPAEIAKLAELFEKLKANPAYTKYMGGSPDDPNPFSGSLGGQPSASEEDVIDTVGSVRYDSATTPGPVVTTVPPPETTPVQVDASVPKQIEELTGPALPDDRSEAIEPPLPDPGRQGIPAPVAGVGPHPAGAGEMPSGTPGHGILDETALRDGMMGRGLVDEAEAYGYAAPQHTWTEEVETWQALIDNISDKVLEEADAARVEARPRQAANRRKIEAAREQIEQAEEILADPSKRAEHKRARGVIAAQERIIAEAERFLAKPRTADQIRIASASRAIQRALLEDFLAGLQDGWAEGMRRLPGGSIYNYQHRFLPTLRASGISRGYLNPAAEGATFGAAKRQLRDMDLANIQALGGKEDVLLLQEEWLQAEHLGIALEHWLNRVAPLRDKRGRQIPGMEKKKRLADEFFDDLYGDAIGKLDALARKRHEVAGLAKGEGAKPWQAGTTQGPDKAYDREAEAWLMLRERWALPADATIEEWEALQEVRRRVPDITGTKEYWQATGISSGSIADQMKKLTPGQRKQWILEAHQDDPERAGRVLARVTEILGSRERALEWRQTIRRNVEALFNDPDYRQEMGLSWANDVEREAAVHRRVEEELYRNPYYRHAGITPKPVFADDPVMVNLEKFRIGDSGDYYEDHWIELNGDPYDIEVAEDLYDELEIEEGKHLEAEYEAWIDEQVETLLADPTGLEVPTSPATHARTIRNPIVGPQTMASGWNDPAKFTDAWAQKIKRGVTGDPKLYAVHPALRKLMRLEKSIDKRAFLGTEIVAHRAGKEDVLPPGTVGDLMREIADIELEPGVIDLTLSDRDRNLLNREFVKNDRYAGKTYHQAWIEIQQKLAAQANVVRRLREKMAQPAPQMDPRPTSQWLDPETGQLSNEYDEAVRTNRLSVDEARQLERLERKFAPYGGAQNANDRVYDQMAKQEFHAALEWELLEKQMETRWSKLGKRYDDFISAWSRFKLLNPLSVSRFLLQNLVGNTSQMALSKEGDALLTSFRMIPKMLDEYGVKPEGSWLKRGWWGKDFQGPTYDLSDTPLGPLLDSAEYGTHNPRLHVTSATAITGGKDRLDRAAKSAAKARDGKIRKGVRRYFDGAGATMSAIESAGRVSLWGLRFANELMTRKPAMLDRVLELNRDTFKLGLGEDDLRQLFNELPAVMGPVSLRSNLERLGKARGADPKKLGAFADRAARDWANMQAKADEAALERTFEVLFSYEYTNVDSLIRKVIPFHFWATRAIPFYANIAIRNPWMVNAYVNFQQGLEKAAKEEGAPGYVQQAVSILDSPLGYTLFFNPITAVGMIAAFESDLGEAPDGETWFGKIMRRGTETFGLQTYPWIGGLANWSGLMGSSNQYLDPTGFQAERRKLGAFIQLAQANGYWPGESRFLGAPFEQMLQNGRGVVSRFGNHVEPYDVNASKEHDLTYLMMDIVAERDGVPSNVPLSMEQLDEVIDAKENPDSRLFQDAVEMYAQGNGLTAFLNSIVPGYIVAQPEHEADVEQLAAQARESMDELDFNHEVYGNYVEDAQVNAGFVPARERAILQGNVASATAEHAELIWQATQYANLGTLEERQAADAYYGILGGTLHRSLTINGERVRANEINRLPRDRRRQFADAWLRSDPELASAFAAYEARREAFLRRNPGYGAYHAWKESIWEWPSLEAYRQAVSRDNPSARAYFEEARRRTIAKNPGISGAELLAELDDLTNSLAAYEAVNGIARSYYDPVLPTGADSQTPQPVPSLAAG